MLSVPEGTWEYHRENYLAVSLWALEEGGGKVENLELVAGPIVQSNYPRPDAMSPISRARARRAY
jgi:hypothetical protein